MNRALNEITNRLHAQPTKVKPTWVKSKAGYFSRNKNEAHANWATQVTGPMIFGSGLFGEQVGSETGGLHPTRAHLTRPPDPTTMNLIPEVLVDPQSEACPQFKGGDGERFEQASNNVLCKEDATVEMEEEKQLAGATGTDASC